MQFPAVASTAHATDNGHHHAHTGTAISDRQTALLIIDMQNDFVLPDAPVCVAGAMTIISNIRALLDHYRDRQWPVFHTIREHRADGSDVDLFRRQQFINDSPFVVTGSDGARIIEPLTPFPGEYRIVKPRFSAFMQTELDLILRRLGITDLVISGTQYPNCIRATVLDAVSLDYRVTLITDACSAQNDAIAEANITDIANIGVSCLTTGEFLAA